MIKEIPFGFNGRLDGHITYVLHVIIKEPWLFARKTGEEVLRPFKGQTMFAVELEIIFHCCTKWWVVVRPQRRIHKVVH